MSIKQIDKTHVGDIVKYLLPSRRSEFAKVLEKKEGEIRVFSERCNKEMWIDGGDLVLT